MSEFKDRNVLFLNSSYEVLDIISWRKAITLFFKERVKILEEFSDSKISSGRTSINMPSIIISLEYVGSLKNAKKVINLNKRNVLVRDNYTCLYCGKGLSDTTGTIDHIHPKSKKGTNTWNNVVASCIKCNRKKDDKTLEEAEMKLLRAPYVPTRNIFLKKYLKKPEYETWKEYFRGKDTEV